MAAAWFRRTFVGCFSQDACVEHEHDAFTPGPWVRGPHTTLAHHGTQPCASTLRVFEPPSSCAQLALKAGLNSKDISSQPPHVLQQASAAQIAAHGASVYLQARPNAVVGRWAQLDIASKPHTRRKLRFAASPPHALGLAHSTSTKRSSAGSHSTMTRSSNFITTSSACPSPCASPAKSSPAKSLRSGRDHIRAALITNLAHVHAGTSRASTNHSQWCLSSACSSPASSAFASGNQTAQSCDLVCTWDGSIGGPDSAAPSACNSPATFVTLFPPGSASTSGGRSVPLPSPKIPNKSRAALYKCISPPSRIPSETLGHTGSSAAHDATSHSAASVSYGTLSSGGRRSSSGGSGISSPGDGAGRVGVPLRRTEDSACNITPHAWSCQQRAKPTISWPNALNESTTFNNMAYDSSPLN